MVRLIPWCLLAATMAVTTSGATSSPRTAQSIGILALPNFVGLVSTLVASDLRGLLMIGMQDAYGPIEFLNIVAFFNPNLTFSIIGQTLDLVPSHAGNTSGLIPSYTFDQNPKLDVLIIPGGPAATRFAINNPHCLREEDISQTPVHVISLHWCSSPGKGGGAGWKESHNQQVQMETNGGQRPNCELGIFSTISIRNRLTKFSSGCSCKMGSFILETCTHHHSISSVTQVIDGNVWTSSGVTGMCILRRGLFLLIMFLQAGMDMIHNFITVALGNGTLADRVANVLEYEVHRDPSFDPFADIWGATDAPATE